MRLQELGEKFKIIEEKAKFKIQKAKFKFKIGGPGKGAFLPGIEKGGSPGDAKKAKKHDEIG